MALSDAGLRPNRRRLKQGFILAGGLICVLSVLVIRERNRSDAGRRLVAAVASNSFAEVNAALDDGADPNMRARFTGMVASRSTGFEFLAELGERLRGKGRAGNPNEWPVLLVALERGAGIEVITALLDRGADVRAKTPDGSPALQWPALTGDSQMAELLIRRGADVNAITDTGETVLQCAIEHDASRKVVELLRRAGAIEQRVP